MSNSDSYRVEGEEMRAGKLSTKSRAAVLLASIVLVFAPVSADASGCCGGRTDATVGDCKSLSNSSPMPNSHTLSPLSVTDDYYSIADDAFRSSDDGCDPVRYQQAKYLLEEGQEFIRRAKPLHERMQEHILLAKTLKGSADMLMNKMPAVGSPKLQGAALKAAMADYSKSLQAFVNNAEKYQFNLKTFKDTIGACHAAQANYDRQRQLYDLHCEQFHVQGFAQVEAPPICPAMDLTQGEAQHVAGELRADEQRLQQAMADLNGRSQILAEANRLAGGNIRNSATQAVRLQEEEKLAKQFGRLKEEYEFLNIQAKVLGVDGRKEAGKTIRRSVSGKVVK